MDEEFRTGASLDDILEWQRNQWDSGVRVRVEELTGRLPWLVEKPELLLDLIYSEVLLREEHGEAPKLEEYLGRFPSMALSIRRQFQIHGALKSDPEDDNAWKTHGSPTIPMISSQAETLRDHDSTEESYPEIEGFKILGIAGKGGNGVAYRAIDYRLNRLVAIKLLSHPWSSSPVMMRQLVREAKASASLVHPNIVSVYQVGEISGSPFLVMEFIEGGPLSNRLRHGPFEVQQAVELCRQITDAIRCAHKQKIIHRDLKPGNILLDTAQRARVCDFGLARHLELDESLHRTGDIIGTPAYMPPEQARGERVDFRADIYAIGAVFYELLSGRPPYPGTTPWDALHQVLTADIVPLRHLNSRIPLDLETICHRCLEKDAAKRYPTAHDLYEELERFQRGIPIKARPIGKMARLMKWVRRNPVSAAVASVIACSLLTIAIVAILSERRVTAALVQTKSGLEMAEKQRDVAVSAMNDLVYRVHDDLQKRQASVDARAEVLMSAIVGLKKIMEVAGDREDTRMTLATALTRYGYILSQQGKMEDAEKSFLSSIEIADTLTSDLGQGVRAQNYSNIALHFVRAANLEAAAEWAQKTLVIAQGLLEKDPKNVDLQNIVIQAKTQQASAATALNDAATALKIRQEAQIACARLYQQNPEKTTIRDQLIDIEQLLITDCLTLGKYRMAAEYIRESLDLILPQNPDAAEDVQLLRRYSSALRSDGIVKFAYGQYEEGIESLKKAITTYRQLAEVEPNRPGFHLRLGTLHEALADCYLAENRLVESDTEVRKQIEEIRKGMELGGPSYSVQRYSIAKGQFFLGSILLRQGKLKESAESFREAATVLEPILELYNTRQIHGRVSSVADLMAALAGVDHHADPDQVKIFRRSIETWQSLTAGKLELYLDRKDQLRTDFESAPKGVLQSMLGAQLAASSALHYSLLLHSGKGTESQLLDAERECTQILQEVLKDPDADPLIARRLPEFKDLRKNDRFMKSFPELERQEEEKSKTP